MSLRERLRIDKNDLDEEIIRHPSLLDEAAQSAVMFASIRDEAKATYEVLEAERAQAIRSRLVDEGTKVTEKLIEQELLQDPKRIKAYKKYLELKREAEEAQALRESFQSRGYMLRDLVSLYSAGYYGDIATGGKVGKESNERVYQADRAKIAQARRSKL